MRRKRSQVHLYTGDEPGPTVTAFCGWRQVSIRHTTFDLKQVTCNHCIGRMLGMRRIALEEAAAKKPE